MGLLLRSVAVAGAAAAVAAVVAKRRFRTLVAGEVVALLSDPGPALGPAEVAARLDAFPEPVQRYLRYAVTESAPAIRTVHLKHGGWFRTRPNQRWFAIDGEQYFTVGKPGFVWTGVIRPAPLVWIEARDRLLSASGSMLVKLHSAFTIGKAGGEPTSQSAAARWVMEACWFPPAFAGPNVEWQALDSRSARVRLRGGTRVNAVAEFDEEGKITRWSADRYRDAGGRRTVLTSWSGRCSEYRDFGGFRVPAFVEGAWQLEGGEFTYVRFRVTSIGYNMTR